MSVDGVTGQAGAFTCQLHLTVSSNCYKLPYGKDMQNDSPLNQRLNRAETLCRTHGLALTVQRRAVLESLLDRTDHPTADDVFEAVAPRLPGLSRTTVYRILDTLVRLRVVRKVPHESAVARFDPCVERHHHLVCDVCGGLIDLPDSVAGSPDVSRLSALGVRVADYCIHFTGTCARCCASSSQPNREEAF